MNYPDTMNDDEIRAELQWYATRANNGRGPFSAKAKVLLKRGYISLAWTSRYTWVLMITDSGRIFLNTQSPANHGANG